jgi:hypothetical protein
VALPLTYLAVGLGHRHCPATSAAWKVIAHLASSPAWSTPLMIRRVDVNCFGVATPLAGK